jgi:hypothetical protein
LIAALIRLGPVVGERPIKARPGGDIHVTFKVSTLYFDALDVFVAGERGVFAELDLVLHI